MQGKDTVLYDHLQNISRHEQTVEAGEKGGTGGGCGGAGWGGAGNQPHH